MTQSVFLIGPMGAGKSTIGRLLSQELKFEFYDSDKVIEDRCGADIPWIFDKEGEAGFREREESVIDELTQQKGIVLSTGGGAVLRAENRQHLASRGTVIYLCTSVEQQLARTARSRSKGARARKHLAARGADQGGRDQARGRDLGSGARPAAGGRAAGAAPQPHGPSSS